MVRALVNAKSYDIAKLRDMAKRLEGDYAKLYPKEKERLKEMHKENEEFIMKRDIEMSVPYIEYFFVGDKKK